MTRRDWKRYPDIIRNYNSITSWIAFGDVVLAFLVVFFWWGAWSADSLIEQYADRITSRVEDLKDIPSTNEIGEKIVEDEIVKNLHKDWFGNQNENVSIDKKMIDKYRWRTQDIFSNCKEEYIASQEEVKDKGLEIQKNKKTFEEVVSTEQSKLTLEKCRKGYCAGLDVINYYHKSENVFQTAVLAENAYYISVINGTEDERQGDLAVAVKCFEEFTAYKNMNPGDGRIKSKFEIAFRIGKMLYREAEILKNGISLENKQTARHFLLYAFECFKYAVEGVGKKNEKYVLYLYYEGLGAFKLLGYIDEISVKQTLCNEVYRLFEDVSKEEIDALSKDNFEDMDKNKFWEVKSLLADNYIGGDRG